MGNAALEGWGRLHLLGTLLMAFRGRSTRTVLMADRLMFWRSREYSTILDTQRHHQHAVSQSEVRGHQQQDTEVSLVD